MSVLKSELKQLVTQEVGVRVEDALEGAKNDLFVLEGRQAGFFEGAKIAEALLGFVDKDLTEGLLELPVATEVKKYVTRCVHALNNAGQNASNLRIEQNGKVKALTQTVSMLSDIVEKEKAKAAAILAAEAAPPSENARDRVMGVAPVSLKELRLAEESVTAPVAVAPEPVSPPAPVVAPPAPLVRFSTKGRGGRKSRASNS
jgi:hypothetical protein